ncbi:hypothetical protein [Taibaiella helva]|uniref:hypothetical protein n=1 Tax=Taibaiella helva TaxID=2301235 RepID=UPI003743002B
MGGLAGNETISVYDATGRKVKTIAAGESCADDRLHRNGSRRIPGTHFFGSRRNGIQESSEDSWILTILLWLRNGLYASSI